MSGKTLFGESVDVGSLLCEFPPEFAGRLTFHLPLEIQALEFAGADRSLILERIEKRLPKAFASGLVDPPLYRWAEEIYTPTAAALLSNEIDARLGAFQHVAPLGAGLAGAAFHGLIRLGYGAMRADAREIGRGLAYMRTRRQVLFSPTRSDNHDTRVVIPSPEEFAGTSVFDQLDLVAGSPGLLSAQDIDVPIPSVAKLAEEAIRLLLRNPTSFVAVHAVDSLHALVEVHHLVCREVPDCGVNVGPLAEWWRSYAWALRACAALVDAAPASTVSWRKYKSMEDLTRTAITESICEAHTVKVVVALRRLAEFGIVEEDAALEAGAAKVAATECEP